MPKTSSATGTAIAISVVVPTCGRMDLLDRCLDALTRQTLPSGSYEVIVVDDEPNHNTLHLVAGWRARTLDRGPRLVYLANSAEHGRHGPAAARNLGWRAAQAPIVAFTDDDGVPSPSWLAQGLAAFGEEVDVLCGLVDKPPLAGPLAAPPRPAGRQGQGGGTGSRGARGTGSHSPNTVLHVPDMIVTSALIPPLAVFWRLVGAIRYRVRFT